MSSSRLSGVRRLHPRAGVARRTDAGLIVHVTHVGSFIVWAGRDAFGSLTSGGTTKLLDRMEAAGLIHRSYGAIDHDHRGVQVELTGRGRTLLRQATDALLAHLPTAAMTVKEIVSLMDELERTASAD